MWPFNKKDKKETKEDIIKQLEQDRQYIIDVYLRDCFNFLLLDRHNRIYTINNVVINTENNYPFIEYQIKYFDTPDGYAVKFQHEDYYIDKFKNDKLRFIKFKEQLETFNFKICQKEQI